MHSIVCMKLACCIGRSVCWIGYEQKCRHFQGSNVNNPCGYFRGLTRELDSTQATLVVIVEFRPFSSGLFVQLHDILKTGGEIPPIFENGLPFWKVGDIRPPPPTLLISTDINECTACTLFRIEAMVLLEPRECELFDRKYRYFMFWLGGYCKGFTLFTESVMYRLPHWIFYEYIQFAWSHNWSQECALLVGKILEIIVHFFIKEWNLV